MKKIIFFLLSVFIFSACDELELTPISNKSVEGFYINEEEIEQGVNACYARAQDYFVNNVISYRMTEVRCDNTMQGEAYDDRETSRFIETERLPLLEQTWDISYNFIARCNHVLKALNEIELSNEKAAQFEGEAKFFRALVYFNLVRYWGGVPLITSIITLDDGYKVTRASVKEVYDQIENDLTDAANLLPAQYPAADRGRVTKWAAKGFLGKVLLFRCGYPLNENRWDAARIIFKEVIDSGKFSFFDSFEDIFRYENEKGTQSVFSIMFKSGTPGEGNGFPTRNGPNDIKKDVSIEQGGLPFGGSPNGLFVTPDLVNSFEQGDIRKDVSIRLEWLSLKGNVWMTGDPFCKKYQNGPVTGSSEWDVDFILLRYTDVLMMYAECLNEIAYSANGEAFSILNQVRNRAGLLPKTASDIPNQQSYRLWMEQERRHEFCFENLRWFDLVRTDRAMDVMKPFLAQYDMDNNLKSRDQYVYPIPQKVIQQNNNIEQNLGY
jgi:hypothetical protein